MGDGEAGGARAALDNTRKLALAGSRDDEFGEGAVRGSAGRAPTAKPLH